MFVEAIVEALNCMKAGKAARPSGVTSELLKVCKNNSVKKSAEVANELLQGTEMPESWRRSDLIPINLQKKRRR